jgi:hypothetical protein
MRTGFIWFRIWTSFCEHSNEPLGFPPKLPYLKLQLLSFVKLSKVWRKGVLGTWPVADEVLIVGGIKAGVCQDQL